MNAILTVEGIPVGPLFGGTQPNVQYGISTHGDVLVNQLADGTDLNDVWAEFQ